MTVQAEVSSRGITEVVHFTTHLGVLGSLAKGALLSRHRLPQEDYLQHILHVNSIYRPEESEFFDKSQNWLDYVNLSISEINRRFFDVSQRWHSNSGVWWAVLSFDSSIMSHNVVFATTNNGYEHCFRHGGVEGFKKLFEPVIRRKGSWSAYRHTRPSMLTTCEQAEVLYPGEVPIRYLKAIYVREGDHSDQVKAWLLDFHYTHVDVLISPEKFIGCQN
ncbi:DUF4433 domain-containing protein [Pseudomonas capsici]|uniref:DUF4433 domain-containing protein n=1 Tax=Pseudomonas capsici TaxID=2810614 RepID=UPI0021F151FF|nr:DUF4433 domain-containing protein [Pseudomonas capsici]MCV4343460.1 DUF4433 domain-containing protein [Pseudomonas capsici]